MRFGAFSRGGNIPLERILPVFKGKFKPRRHTQLGNLRLQIKTKLRERWKAGARGCSEKLREDEEFQEALALSCRAWPTDGKLL